MKANEFIKKFGIDEASEIVVSIPDKFKFKCLSNTCWDTNTYKYSDRFKPRNSLVNIADLKRLVESHELIEQFDDIDCAKAWVSDLDSDWPYQVKGADTKFFKWQLEQAILDVESCM